MEQAARQGPAHEILNRMGYKKSQAVPCYIFCDYNQPANDSIHKLDCKKIANNKLGNLLTLAKAAKYLKKPVTETGIFLIAVYLMEGFIITVNK